MPTLPDYPGVSQIYRPNLPLPRTSHRISQTKRKKPTKYIFLKYFDRFFVFLVKIVLIFDEFLRFDPKISTLNNFFRVKKR